MGEQKEIKYLKLFLSIFYLIIIIVYSFFLISGARALMYILMENEKTFFFLMEHDFLYKNLRYIPSIIQGLAGIGFFIYMLLIKNRYLFWGAFCLAFGVSNLTDLVLTIPVIFYTSNYLPSNTSILVGYGQVCILTFRFIVFIGLLILFFFFRNKYKKQLKG